MGTCKWENCQSTCATYTDKKTGETKERKYCAVHAPLATKAFFDNIRAKSAAAAAKKASLLDLYTMANEDALKAGAAIQNVTIARGTVVISVTDGNSSLARWLKSNAHGMPGKVGTYVIADKFTAFGRNMAYAQTFADTVKTLGAEYLGKGTVIVTSY